MGSPLHPGKGAARTRVVLGQVHDGMVQAEAILPPTGPAMMDGDDFRKKSGELNRSTRGAVTLSGEPVDDRAPCPITERRRAVAARYVLCITVRSKSHVRIRS